MAGFKIEIPDKKGQAELDARIAEEKEADAWRNGLYDKYKHLFATYDGEETERSYYKKGDVLRGIECGGGWRWVVEKFLDELEWYRKNRLRLPNPDFNNEVGTDENGKWLVSPTIAITLEENQVKIFQIKEKFGQLRIYVTEYLPHMHTDIERLIARAEVRADLTCYNCGTVTNKLEQTKGWVSYLCPECMEKLNARRTIKA